MQNLTRLVPILLLALTFISSAGGTVHQQQLPEGEGKDLFAKKCSMCHALEDATSSHRTRGQWDAIIDQMIEMGAPINEEEKATILGYLGRNFGKINVNFASAEQIESFLKISANDAKAIVAYRTEHGEFKSFDDMVKVPGIDAKALEEKRDWIAY